MWAHLLDFLCAISDFLVGIPKGHSLVRTLPVYTVYATNIISYPARFKCKEQSWLKFCITLPLKRAFLCFSLKFSQFFSWLQSDQNFNTDSAPTTHLPTKLYILRLLIITKLFMEINCRYRTVYAPLPLWRTHVLCFVNQEEQLYIKDNKIKYWIGKINYYCV